MTNKEINISFSPHPRIDAQDFLVIKKVNDSCDTLGLAINLDMKNKLGLEDIGEEVTCLIVNIIKERYLKEHIEKKYKSNYRDELELIYAFSLTVFDRMENMIRDIIMKKAYNYLEEYSYMNIDGFLRFRLKEIYTYLSSISEIGLEKYLEEKEQSEFINVLKYFIDMQESRIDLLIVNILDNGSFKLYDKDGNKVDNIDDEDIISMAIKEDLNYGDFLISTLLALCPNEIKIIDYLNDESSKVVIETIKSIFEERVSITIKK